MSDILVDKLEKLSNNRHADLLYLQTNKGVYETEENIWFKAYILDEKYNIPSNSSNVLFVQLINDKTGNSVWEEKYEIENGFVDGHLYLQDSLEEGQYSLTAYSSKSYYKDNEEFHAVREIYIFKNIGSKRKLQFKKKITDSVIHLNTFPEGGNLVNDIESRIAFKATNSQGFPIQVIGTLYEDNIRVLEFESEYEGMGSFLLTPKADKDYHIELKNDSDNKKYYLPKILAKGTVLQLLNNTKEELRFKVTKTLGHKKEKIYLRVQAKGMVYYIARAILNKELLINIPLEDIPQGIVEVTLFNDMLLPLAERLVYVNHNKKLNISTTLNKEEYATREKVTMKIRVTDENGLPAIAHLGLGVYDRLYKNSQDSKNIFSHYHLSTQLKGKLYNPIFYFDERNKNRKEALNLLMLTQGWRNYLWNEENLNRYPKFLHYILSDSLTGILKPEKTNKLIKQIGEKFVMVFTADSSKGKTFIGTNDYGQFSLNHNHFKMAEQAYLYLKPMMSQKNKYAINIRDSFFDTINHYRKTKIINYPLSKFQEIKSNKVTEPFIVTDEVNKLKEIVLSTKKNKIFRDKYLGVLDSLAKLNLNVDYVCSSGILNCPTHGLNHPDNTKPIEGRTYEQYVGFKWVDESRRQYTFQNSKVEKYKYPELTEAYLLKKFNLVMLKGYYGKREFYQPAYDEESINDPFPDYRNTLFWKPDIITNSQGEATIQFFCSDIDTTFLGVIEGVDYTGLIGSNNFKFIVHKPK